ncbi:MAG TPA: hypothetical protein VGH91_12595 [Gammaproteobacteria bacterium]
MEAFFEFIDRPIGKYIVVMVVSLASAAICAWIGGTAGTLFQAKYAGVTIQAVGALGAFLAILVYSLRLLEKMEAARPAKAPKVRRDLKIYLIPREIFEPELKYKCVVTLFDERSGNERKVDVIPRREAGHLTLSVRNVESEEMYMVELTAGKLLWKSEYHTPSAPKTEMKAHVA